MVWCVTKGNFFVLEVVAFSTFTAVTDMMTAGTSVMREGKCSACACSQHAGWSGQVTPLPVDLIGPYFGILLYVNLKYDV